ncbi:ribonuclease H-like domain-containing protein [Paenibacillus spongiae]|uniref:Ribonuclease H-like domain-containing protein n=1 Tax=Paenibacillus spongiae TaxID=2909671 RepID=A0ABY5S4L2_9BACL|nr:ribonuclease H-like domain-containing protein [Paenibacillus spongiae]UVI27678.1 ribonuclease H-like domain-containing protein [Paenibacillus spongiae]
MSSLRDRMKRLRGNSTAEPAETAVSAGAEEPGEIVERAALDEGFNEELDKELDEELDERLDNSQQLSPEWFELGVRIMATDEGDFLLRETRYPLDYRHGVHGLDELREAVAGLSAFQTGASPKPRNRSAQTAAAVSAEQVSRQDVHPERILFLDLETTGLGVGAGNVPFMVGLGYMTRGAFVVEQMLIRHPAEERAMLAYLCDKLTSYTHLATYNGRTFDWPVLHNRFILNGFRQFKWEPIHIDLLHPSRSVWRNTLVSCKLSHVEEERLGITREDDVPGSLAPAIYFQFLADGNPRPLHGVFRHNEIDMVSLACLAIRFGHLLSDGLGSRVPHPEGVEELLRTGLWLEKMKGASCAEPLFERLINDDQAPPSVYLALAERDKKCGNWPRAVLLWQKVVYAAEMAAWPGWGAHIELAMYHEHKTKQFDSALSLAEEALALALRRYSGLRLDAKRRAEVEGLRKRIDRLRTKIGRLSG